LTQGPREGRVAQAGPPELDDRGLVPFTAVRQAAAGLEGVSVVTPLLPAVELSETSGAEVRLKLESLQRTGSFKFRGAYTFVNGLPDDGAARGVITYSSGNHGQAVAMAAGLRGIPCVVVMPTTAPAVKREGALRLGAEVVMEGTTSLERKRRAEAIQAERGLAMVPPFDDPTIIAGQGTAALEAAEAWPEMDTWLVCVGGGGLASGSGVSLRSLRPGARIIGVEAEGAPAMRRSLDAGAPVTLEGIDTIADGLAPVRPGDLTFHHVRTLFDDVVTVTDEAIREAAQFLFHRQKLVVEYSGAAAVAALRSGAVELRGRRVGVTISGGNLDPSILREWLDGAPAGTGG
jgi:threo-3-hydroxy-L-aspartate ammonia-lyase